jgi:hypothetical protein
MRSLELLTVLQLATNAFGTTVAASFDRHRIGRASIHSVGGLYEPAGNAFPGSDFWLKRSGQKVRIC